MCTAITLLTQDHYFGRNLDLEYSYNEMITITPRNYPFAFQKMPCMQHHYAIIGMAYTPSIYPLYYDATNEAGLSMAGLKFPDEADYKTSKEGFDNITPYEFIPWILGQCSSVMETKVLLEHTNLLARNYSEELPLTPLHWIISDRESSITVESVAEGLKVYDNPLGVLTNSPEFPFQMFNQKHNKMIPGDWSSLSRFVKASYLKTRSVCGTSEEESISQFFHLLGSVEYQRGCTPMDNGLYEITQYTSCCNTDKGIYYYRTYENSQITAVDMHKENLDGRQLIQYPLVKETKIRWQN